MTAGTHPIDKEQVMAYLDGELTPEQAARIAMHLDQCGECRDLSAELRGISSQMLVWSVEPVPRRPNDAVMEALNKSGASEPGFLKSWEKPREVGWRNLWRNPFVWGAPAILAIVLCLVAFLPPRTYEMKSTLPARRSYLPAEEVAKQERREIPSESSPESGPMIARIATLAVSVKDFGVARMSMDGIVRMHHGYVSSLNISTVKGAPQSMSAKLMIPAAQVDAALADLKALGRVEQELQGSEEVTSQVVDLDARLKNARATEAQLADILRARTGKIGDVLEVEKEMARVRGEIETMEANQKELRDRVAFASIDLNLTEEYQAQLGDGSSAAGRQIRNALVDGYHTAAAGLLSIFLFTLSIGPSLLLWGLIGLWPARWAWRRWHKARAQAELHR